MCFTPNGRSASINAFMTVGVPPTVPSSPTPFAPSGLILHGVVSSVWVSKLGKVVKASGARAD